MKLVKISDFWYFDVSPKINFFDTISGKLPLVNSRLLNDSFNDAKYAIFWYIVYQV